VAKKSKSQPGHAQETVHGDGVGLQSLLAIVPRADTPGFDLLSPRAVHAWLALYDHLRRFGHMVTRNVRSDLNFSELSATWTVRGVASACGIQRNQAGKALAELVEYGWLTRDDLRRIGQFGGFSYSLRLPENLSPQGKFKLKKKLKEKHGDLEDLKQRALRYLDQAELDETLMKTEYDSDLETRRTPDTDEDGGDED
jgi:hypothetical protein